MYRKEASLAKEAAGERWQAQVFRRIIVAALVAVFLSGSLFFSYFLISRMQRIQHPATVTIATNGASRWVGDAQTTAPTFVAPPTSAQTAVDPQFQKYYQSHAAANHLGAPLAPGFPILQGWIQFFASGALLLPAPDQSITTSRATAGDSQLDDLISSAFVDPATGVARLPLFQALLTVGSQARVGGASSTLTYVDLRSAVNPELMVSQPAGTDTPATAPQKSSGQQNIFVAGGTRGGKTVGHVIPGVIWSYITGAEVSPDGWQNDFGAPLSDALPFTLTVNGGAHHMLVQVFWRDVALLDQGVQGASGQSTFVNLTTGLDYLRTLGPPSVAVKPNMSIWATGDTTLLSAAGTGKAAAHVGQQFPLTLVGGAAWVKGALWYQVQWKSPKTSGKGWAQAAALTFTSPGSTPGWASFDVLSSSLAGYLASLDNTAAAVVYDVTRQRYYTYNMDGRFIMGSSMKVAIMFTFLNMTEKEDREPTKDEMCLLTAMIEHSDNNAASAFFFGYPYQLCGSDFEPIGRAAGVSRYLTQIGVSGLDPDDQAWGYSTISPLVMVKLLTLLEEGKVLTQRDRALAFNLMEHIESDQRVGVGDTAPKGATVAMKDGWLQEQGPDGPETGPWAMNSSGIVTLGGETYIIAVYTGEHNTLADGQAIARKVCSAVAAALA